MTDSASTTIELAPWVAIIQPYITAAVTAAIPILLTFALAKFSQWTNIRIDNETRDRFTKAAQTEAGVIFAKGGAEIATKSINIGSPEVAAAANTIVKTLPNLVAATGMTETRMASIVAGEVGKLQAAAQSTDTNSESGK